MPSVSDFGECQSCTCFALRCAARAITQRYDRELRPSGLRTTQFTLLVVLARSGSLTLQRLAEALGVERTTLTRNLRPLAARGYVTTESGDDRRARVLSVTKKGIAAARAALPHWRRAQRSAAAQLSPAALKALAAIARPPA